MYPQFSEKAPRGAAINTVKRWVPDVKSMDEMTRTFALQMLWRLETRKRGRQRSTKDDMDTDGVTDEEVEDEMIIPDEATRTPYIPEQLEFPVPKSVVLQHVELLFVLSLKVPDFLDKCVSILPERYLIYSFPCGKESSMRMGRWTNQYRRRSSS
jgi:symplekin